MYAFSEMVDRMSPLRDSHGHFMGMSPGLVGLEYCEKLFTHLRNKKPAAGKFLVRYFLTIRQALETQELGNVYSLPGLGGPADGLTKTRRDIVPLLRRLEPGAYTPGALRPLEGVASKEI